MSRVCGFSVVLLVLLLDGATRLAARQPQNDGEKRNQRSYPGCTECELNGKKYRGHSRFSYEEGCNRFQCTCYCNGSYNCPAQHTIQLCREDRKSSHSPESVASSSSSHSESVSSSSSSSSRNSSSESSSSSLSTREEGSSLESSSATSAPASSKVEGNRRVCRDCEILGKDYRARSYFSLIDGCIKYNQCICRCDGSWNCPAERSESICDDEETKETSNEGISDRVATDHTESSANSTESEVDTSSQNNQNRSVIVESRNPQRCLSCYAGGIERRGNAYFELEETCIKYRYCLCRCNGSWNCPQRYAVNTCSEQNNGNNETLATTRHEQAQTATCYPCSVKGKSFSGNSSFEVRHGCIQYSDCFCRCNGSWVCPDSGARNLCQPPRRVVTCSGCEVNLKRYPGNSHFSIQYGCVNFTNCVCNCNGSWSCPKSGEINTCDNSRHQVNKTESSSESSATTRENVRTDSGTSNLNLKPARCEICLVYGKHFRGGSRFSVVNGCTNYTNCLCRCDGSWTCEARFATNICIPDNTVPTSPPQTTESRQCLTCNARGEIFTGNSHFNLTDGCTQFTNCLCRCDGSWDCPPRYSRNICETSRRLKERGPFGCINCNARGKIVRGGATFTLIENCLQYADCECNCDGSWKCSGDKANDICLNNTRTSGGCLTCKASDGSLHRPNAPFSFVKDCVEYNCDCNCDGSWKCPAEKSRWACTDKCRGCDVKGRQITSNTTFIHKTGCLEYTCDCRCNGSWSCPGRTARNTCPTGVNVNCNKCIISPREQYEGETDFVLRQDCIHYKCRCNCDGSYTCPGKDARNVCRGERLGGCRSCVVSERQIFRGDADFSFRKGCNSYQCRCNCDGSWNCPTEDVRDVCVGEVPGGCRVCRVSDTEIYRANTQFDLRKGCISYKCQCNCDGGWKCPGKDARDVCKGEIPGGCRSCMISENEFYPGNSNFEMVKNCIHYKCRCNCNGGYNCPGRTAKRVCRNDLSPLTTQCKQCRVSEKEKFQGNTTFFLDRSCHRYECKCNCDGSWNCPSELGKNICSERLERVPESETKQCRPCKVRNQQIPSESSFKLQRRCYQYDCECRCNGRWSCDSKNRVNTCRQLRPGRSRQASIRSHYETSRQDVLTNPQITHSTYESEKGSTYHENNVESNQKVVPAESESVVNHGNNRNHVESNSHANTRHRTIIETDQRSQQRQTETSSRSQTRNQEGLLDYLTNAQGCRPCKVGDETKTTNELFELEAGCTQYKNCLCLCSGHYECAQEIYICNNNNRNSNNNNNNNNNNPVNSVDMATSDTQVSTSSNRFNRKKEVSSWVSKHGINSTRILQGKDGTGNEYAVQIDTDYKPMNARNSRRVRPSGNVRPSSSRSYPTAAPSHHNRTNSNSNSNIGATNEANRVVNARRTPMRTGNVRASTSSSSSHSSSTSRRNGHESSHGSSSSVSSFTGSGSPAQTGGCTQCLANQRTYSTGAKFDMRRGCVLYRCTCLCSGSYRCAVMSDNACTAENRQTSCSNCIYHGMVFPGGYSFKIRESCNEKTCKCNCNGTYSCPSSSTLRGCRLGIPTGHQIPSSSGSVFQSTGGSFPISSGYIVRTVNVQKPCTNNCRQTRITSTSTRQHHVQSSGHDSVDTPTCGSCTLEGRTHAGNSSFAIQKGCIYFDCFCHCGGSWKCAGRTSQDCLPKVGPETAPGNRESSGCRSCLVQETEFPAHSKFLLRQGCFEYKCSCNCDGSWVCPDQQPTNKCPPKPQRTTEDRFEPFALKTDATFVRVNSNNEDDKRTLSYEKLTDPSRGLSTGSESPRNGRVPGCRRCFMHGKHVEPLAMFVNQEGCFETLCHCLCNGEASCPDSASVNVCELPDRKPMGERAGCKVGRRTHYTRVFALVEDCFQRVCVCHDNGTWSCKKSAQDKKVC